MVNLIAVMAVLLLSSLHSC